MHLANHINPDHFLETPDGRVDSPVLGKAAWELAYRKLADQLEAVGPAGVLYVVCGLQGSGKSTWVTRNAPKLEARAVFFDAALPSRKHRSRSLALAAGTNTPAVAVWLNVPLELVILRNATRPKGEQVPGDVIHHVYEQWDPPSISEGFVRVIEVETSQAGKASSRRA